MPSESQVRCIHGWDVAPVMSAKPWPVQPYQKAIIKALSDPKIKRISLFVKPRRPAAHPNRPAQRRRKPEPDDTPMTSNDQQSPVRLQPVVRALAEEWASIARELKEDISQMPDAVRHGRNAEIRVCEHHAKQLRKALRKCSNADVSASGVNNQKP